jgi:hypothetical protein
MLPSFKSALRMLGTPGRAAALIFVGATVPAAISAGLLEDRYVL